jgi:predicted ATPase
LYLKQIDVSNFKSFEQASLELPRHGLVVLAGPNNAGKSNLLAALGSPGGGSSAVRRTGSLEPCEVVEHLVLDDEDIAFVYESARVPVPSSLPTGMMRDVRVTHREQNMGNLSMAGLATNDPSGAPVELISIERDDVLGVNKGRRLKLQNLLATGAATWSEADAFDEFTAQSNSVMFFQDTQLFPLVGAIQSRWAQRVFRVDAAALPALPTRPMKEAPSLAPTGENLFEVLLGLKLNHPNRYRESVEIVRSIAPELGNLDLRAKDDQIWVEFVERDSGRVTLLSETSPGIQQIVFLVIAGVTAQSGALVLLDEPETHLHPAAQRNLADHLVRWSERLCIVTTTHSPILIDRAYRHGDLWAVSRRSGSSVLARSSETVTPLLEDLGVRPSDVLGASGLILVEGSTDEPIFRQWLHGVESLSSFVVQAAGGGDPVRDVDGVADALARMDTLGRPVVFVRDRDELPQSRVDELQARGRVLVLDRREIENYLMDVDAIATRLSQISGKPVHAADVENRLMKAVEGLRELVLLKRVAAQLPNIRLVERKPVGKLAKQQAGKTEFFDYVRSQYEQGFVLVSSVKKLWDDEESALGKEWEARSRDLAPGQEVLEQIWKEFECPAFSKATDGAALAQLVKPPRDLIDRLVELVERQKENY